MEHSIYFCIPQLNSDTHHGHLACVVDDVCLNSGDDDDDSMTYGCF